MRPPADEQSAEYRQYLDRLSKRLATNPYLDQTSACLHDRAGMESAINSLTVRANEIVKKTASTIFVSTAVSQNGRLDSFMVLAAQSRMIRQVACIYNQRPTLRELVQLYANVASTVFAASGSLTAFNPKLARRYASVTAAAMLGSIVSASAGSVVKSMAAAARKAGESTFESAAAGVHGVGTRLNPFKSASEK